MSRDLDRETQAAIEALVYRLKNRTDEDDEPFAQEYVTALRARGWRPTEARTPWDYRNPPHGDGLPASEETVARLEETRRSLDEIIARQHATRRRLTLEPPAGAA
jgi:hypothetical protein